MINNTVNGIEVDQQANEVEIAQYSEEEVPRFQEVQENGEVKTVEVEAGASVAPQVTDPSDRPAFLEDADFFLGLDDRVVSVKSGEQVAFVNKRFGLSGDEFTQETHDAVVNWKQENNIVPADGRVYADTYSRL